MVKKVLKQESGFTLIEVLAVLTIITILIGLTFNVLATSIQHNNKSQSNTKLRQEANVIVNTLRQLHKGENEYKVCYDHLLSHRDISIQSLHLNGKSIDGESQCIEKIDPFTDLTVDFEIIDGKQSTYELKTVIEGEASKSIVVVKPKPPIKKNGFYDFLKDNNIFMYGSQYVFHGNQVVGPNATMVIKGSLLVSQLNGGAFSNLSNIYIDGKVDLDGGSAALGSSASPGKIFVNGNLTLWNGTRNIYGDVYVNGNLRLKDARVHGNIYVNGNVELGWTPELVGNAKIYYTGTRSYPNNFNQAILNKMVKQSEVPRVSIPGYEIPPLRSPEWYKENGYTQVVKPDNMKLYGDLIKVDSHGNNDTFNNVIIVSKGDIIIGGNSWIKKMTGVLLAPNGKVTFNGESFEGMIVAKNGFHVTSGGTNVKFINIQNFIKDAKDFPLKEN